VVASVWPVNPSTHQWMLFEEDVIWIIISSYLGQQVAIVSVTVPILLRDEHQWYSPQGKFLASNSQKQPNLLVGNLRTQGRQDSVTRVHQYQAQFQAAEGAAPK
jgi:hypothetical protein